MNQYNAEAHEAYYSRPQYGPGSLRAIEVEKRRQHKARTGRGMPSPPNEPASLEEEENSDDENYENPKKRQKYDDDTDSASSSDEEDLETDDELDVLAVFTDKVISGNGLKEQLAQKLMKYPKASDARREKLALKEVLPRATRKLVHEIFESKTITQHWEFDEGV